jgi:hypothetical protein
MNIRVGPPRFGEHMKAANIKRSTQLFDPDFDI